MHTCPDNTCDGSGIAFTQSLEQGGHADADNVRACPTCGYHFWQGYEDPHVAERLAVRLLEALPESDLDGKRRAWTQVVACYGDDPDVPSTVALRSDIADASLFGHEHTPAGGFFVTKAVVHERGPRWELPYNAALELGDSVRILLDARVGDATSRHELVGPLREHAQTILDASEFLLTKVPALRVPDFNTAEELQQGLFVGLVKLAEAYARSIGGAPNDALRSLLQGLAENLEDEFGPT